MLYYVISSLDKFSFNYLYEMNKNVSNAKQRAFKLHVPKIKLFPLSYVPHVLFIISQK